MRVPRATTVFTATFVAVALALGAPKESAADSLSRETYFPHLGDLMNTMQVRHLKLWFAGRSNNWPLAAYEVDLMMENFRDIAVPRPNRYTAGVSDKSDIPLQLCPEAWMEDLKRLTETRLHNGYYAWLSRFFKWLIEEGYYTGPQPKFSYLSPKNLLALPRASFDQSEVLKIFRMPLFTGCLSRTRIWQPGKYFLQNNLYWAYIIALMTGMRPGEIGQLCVSDLEKHGNHVLINLQLFDPAQGRVAGEDARQFNTKMRCGKSHCIRSSWISSCLSEPMPSRRSDARLSFRNGSPTPKRRNAVGQPISKSWQYLKRELKLSRKNVSLYGARH